MTFYTVRADTKCAMASSSARLTPSYTTADTDRVRDRVIQRRRSRDTHLTGTSPGAAAVNHNRNSESNRRLVRTGSNDSTLSSSSPSAGGGGGGFTGGGVTGLDHARHITESMLRHVAGSKSSDPIASMIAYLEG